MQIIDSTTQKGIDLVDIFSENPNIFTTTNSKGEADVSDFKNCEVIFIRANEHQNITISYKKLVDFKFKLLLIPTNLNMEEVNVSANKWHRNEEINSSRTTNISQKDRNLFQPQTTADLLALSGKVFIQKSQQGGGSPMIRGFATNRLLYSVDGVRMNTAIFREGNIQNVISLDAYTLENTQIIYGPGAIQYGSDAIGGVMNFQTLIPNLSLNDSLLIVANASSRYASANQEFTFHGDINFGWKKWSTLVSFTVSDFEDLQMGKNGPDDYLKSYKVTVTDTADIVEDNLNPRIQNPSAYTQGNLMYKLRFKPNEKWDFQYALHYSETSEYGRYDRHLRTKNNKPFYAEWNYGPQRWMMNLFQINYKSKSKLFDEFYIRFAVQNFEESRISRKLNNPIRSIQRELVVAYSANVDFSKKINASTKLYYGAEYVLNDVKSTARDENIYTNENFNAQSRYPKSLWQAGGIYVSVDRVLNKKMNLGFGARYSIFAIDAQFDTTFYAFQRDAKLKNDALNGNISWTYKPSQKTLICINLATAFRAPNVDDLGKIFDSQPNSVTIPNPNLKAEYAKGVDLSITQLLGKLLKLEIVGFYTHLDNALVRRDFQFNGQDSIVYQGETVKVQAIQNAAYLNVYGGTISLNLKLKNGLSSQFVLNFQKGREQLDNETISPSRHAAPLFLNYRLRYDRKKLSLLAYIDYNTQVKFEDLPVSEQAKTDIYAKDGQGNPYTPEWYTLNFKANYSILQNFVLSFGVENITDQRYRAYSSGISGAGRSYVIAGKFSF